ncbi:KpsF/GutQ family sugar-phosphate isomerase [bacterium]|nr:KpsF/GutQ family sugar-phosphate isomerase [bacterium]
MIIKRAQEVIRIEGKAVLALQERIGEPFQCVVELLLNCRGRVIVCGMGKSGIIGQKIASTLTSTGTAALFLHPAEGVHGDLGAVLEDDIVICISNSGQTEEILRLLPLFKRKDVPIIAMTGNMNSPLAASSDIVLDIHVEVEACPYDVVPTASTTATLAMGDALALSLFEARGLTMEDFALLHPAGNIGRKLLLRVDDIMRSGDDIARVDKDTPLSKTILEITSKRLGATCVFNKGRMCGIITDGDLRRLMEKKHDIHDLKAKDVMSASPITVPEGILAAKALRVMEEHSINQLVIVNKNGDPVGMVHIHDLLKSGLA